ncbi:hypothetical protein R3P38DRAFT_2776838 [Favolaschia claudopus]|uniref:Fungal STAND N-terminal Goodbye domain-containing protein n=1 Tax=Favolaschia claudopus TaxID=2862362 RepID=A0AAW0BNX4_9AGAR
MTKATLRASDSEKIGRAGWYSIGDSRGLEGLVLEGLTDTLASGGRWEGERKGEKMRGRSKSADTLKINLTGRTRRWAKRPYILPKGVRAGEAGTPGREDSPSLRLNVTINDLVGSVLYILKGLAIVRQHFVSALRRHDFLVIGLVLAELIRKGLETVPIPSALVAIFTHHPNCAVPLVDMDRFSRHAEPSHHDLSGVSKFLATQSQSSYQQETGIDLMQEATGQYRHLLHCECVDDILDLIDGLASKHSRENSSYPRARSMLRTTSELVLVLNDAMGEVAGALGIPGGKTLFVALGILLKTAHGGQDRFTALVNLLSEFEQFFRRLNIQRNMEYSHHSKLLLSEICAQFLHVLALANKVFSLENSDSGGVKRLWHKTRTKMLNAREALLQNRDIKLATERLDTLTRQELQMTMAEVFSVVTESRMTLRTLQKTTTETLTALHLYSQAVQTALAEALSTRLQDTSRTLAPREYDAEHAPWLRGSLSQLEPLKMALQGAAYPHNPLDRVRCGLLFALPFLALPRAIAQYDIINLYDVLGNRRRMPTNMWMDPSQFVRTLQGFFKDNPLILRLIESNGYCIQDSEASLLEPGSSVPPARHAKGDSLPPLRISTYLRLNSGRKLHSLSTMDLLARGLLRPYCLETWTCHSSEPDPSHMTGISLPLISVVESAQQRKKTTRMIPSDSFI